MDYYQILGVEKDASILTIKKAYKTQVLTCHPDKVSPSERPQAEEKFKLLTEAYQVLADSGKRSQYDSSHSRPDHFQDSWNIFDDFFSQRDLFSDPFSHPFFSPPSDLFTSSSLLSQSSRRSDPFLTSDRFFTSSSTCSQTMRDGISKTIKETRSGNYIIREEIISENGKVVSRTKTSTLSRPGSYKIHIS